MIQARLNDAAIKLHQLLNEVHVKHGIFGGYAIGVLGGPRESKDIDCIASVSKESLISLVDGKAGFQYISQTRPDFVAFFWSDKPDRKNPVLVEVFVEQFEGMLHSSLEPWFLIQAGASHAMKNVVMHKLNVSGQLNASGSISLLDPVYIFKGKLRAAATRGKFHDSADIRWLASRSTDHLKLKGKEFNLGLVGLAMKRYPELEATFLQLGLDVMKAKDRVASIDLSQLPPPKVGDVQSGLLG